MTESKDLLKLESLKPHEVFGEGGADIIIKQARALAIIAEPDITTAKGREAIASMAYKVARSKTALDDMGKELVSDLKKRSGAIDEIRRHIRDSFDALKDEVRRPLTEWEDAEKNRIQAHQTNMEAMRKSLIFEGEALSVEIERRLEFLENSAAVDFQEFAEQAETVRQNSINRLSELLAARIKAEAEAEEIMALRAEKAARDAKDAEIERQRAADDKARVEAEKQIQAAKDAAAQTIRDAEARIEREAEAARQKIAEEKRRSENKEHRRAVNQKIIAALIENGFTESQAKAVITLILGNFIPHVTINY